MPLLSRDVPKSLFLTWGIGGRRRRAELLKGAAPFLPRREIAHIANCMPHPNGSAICNGGKQKAPDILN